MSATPSRDSVTGLLHAVEEGDREALNALFPLVYEELTALAHRQRRAWRGNLTLDTTAVVHEAYLKLADQTRIPAGSRAHFFGVAAKAMRHILCNYARDRGRQKRGGGVQHVTFEPDRNIAAQPEFSSDQADTLMALDDALRSLEQFAARPSRVVECRFFGGMSVEETASALGIAPRTVKRDWNFARAWLRREMQLALGPSD
ncbi:MAG TPA: sigma-70 family RNA polymerase sigma factor [Gemmatimonadaceae bacterium]